jgi:hypothetical protein
VIFIIVDTADILLQRSSRYYASHCLSSPSINIDILLGLQSTGAAVGVPLVYKVIVDDRHVVHHGQMPLVSGDRFCKTLHLPSSKRLIRKIPY